MRSLFAPRPALAALAAVLLSAGPASAREFFVSVGGADEDAGTADAPLRTIQRAADLAMPGDVVTVRAGLYREEVTPPRGGESDGERIVYRAAEGEHAEIRGSEVVTGWEPVDADVAGAEGVWSVEIDNELFGSFNPFADVVKGDWFNPLGREHHTGSVYLDGEVLFEAADAAGLADPEHPSAWYAEVGEDATRVMARFGGADPNDGLTEVNARQTVFYPRKPFVNYITVSGFTMRHAAPNWAPPTAEQVGLIGTHWSKGWVIEDNVISHSINAGISLGKYGDEFDNLKATAPAYLASIDRALANGWDRDTVGSHTVRNNEVSHCEQAGIVGSMGASFSTITGNHIHHIHQQARFGGAERAGIKFHAPIDLLLADNRIHDAPMGLWLDWMTQGTRVTGNLFYRNEQQDLFLEVNHGPFVVDNNVFLSELAVKHQSQGGAYVNNLFGGAIGASNDPRTTPYFKAHSTVKVADHAIDVGDDRFYNNVFVGHDGQEKNEALAETLHKARDWRLGYGLWFYGEAPQAPTTAGNVCYAGAKPYPGEDAVVVAAALDPVLTEEGDAVYLELTIDPAQREAGTVLVTTDLLGLAEVPQLPFLNPDRSPLRLDTDFSGEPRDPEAIQPGPFADPGTGRVRLRVW